MKQPGKVFIHRMSFECEYVALRGLWADCANHMKDWHAQIVRGVDLSQDAVDAMEILQEDIAVRMRWLLEQIDGDPYIACPDYPPAPLPRGWA